MRVSMLHPKATIGLKKEFNHKGLQEDCKWPQLNLYMYCLLESTCAKDTRPTCHQREQRGHRDKKNHWNPIIEPWAPWPLPWRSRAPTGQAHSAPLNARPAFPSPASRYHGLGAAFWHFKEFLELSIGNIHNLLWKKRRKRCELRVHKKKIQKKSQQMSK